MPPEHTVRTVRTGLFGLHRKGTGLLRAPLPAGTQNYLIRDHLAPTAATAARKVDWTPKAVLNQGQRGACVGCAFTAELIAPPADADVTKSEALRFALHWWRRAKWLSYGGSAYEDRVWDDANGTYMHNAAVVGRELGAYERFYWATDIDDVRTAVQHGPVPIAVYVDSWLTRGPDQFTNNFRPVPANPRTDFGAHAMCITAYDPNRPFPKNKLNAIKNAGPDTPREPAYFIRNSWGSWGEYWTGIKIRRANPRPGRRFRWKINYQATTGGGWIRETDLARILEQYGWDHGAAVLPVGRVDPDDLGGLRAIMEAHPITAPKPDGWNDDDTAWGPAPEPTP